MNRWDEIQGAARDVADWVCEDPADRNRMADELIKLCGLMIEAVGKSVAVAGEGELSRVSDREFELDTMSIEYTPEEVSSLEADFERDMEVAANQAHGVYLTGERIQAGAREAAHLAGSAECDLEWYELNGLKPVWAPDPSKHANTPEGN